MTRANIIIIHDGFLGKAYFEKGSSGYPKEVVPELVRFLIGHVSKGAIERKDEKILYNGVAPHCLATLLNNLYLSLGQVGNPYYFYELDLTKGTIKAWESKTRWINAPANWKEKGYNCYKGTNGKDGYTTWIKGKVVFSTDINKLLKETKFEVVDEVFEVPAIS
jgi:hypothetical protein